MSLRGRAWKYGDDIDTDVIYPARHLLLHAPDEVKQHAMEGLEPGFAGKIASGDILVVGKNFGCGSAREQAAGALKAAGVGAVVAESLARAFFRNAINVGLAVIESKGIGARIAEGDELELDLEAGLLRNLTRGEQVPVGRLPPLLLEILRHGGATAWCRSRLERGEGR